MLYAVESAQLTPKTVVYKVIIKDRVIAQFGKLHAAERFADYLESNNVRTMSDYLALSWEFRKEYIFASGSDRPNLPYYIGA